MLNEVMLTKAHLEPGRTSTMKLFALQLSHILKTYLIAFKLHFLTNSSFRQKTCNPENFGRKSLRKSQWNIFFSKFKITQRNGAINKQKQPSEVFYKKRCS